MNRLHNDFETLDSPIIIEPPATAEFSVIWLHGLGADGYDFAGIVPQLNLPEHLSIRFVFPHAPVQPVTVNGGMAMRAWYDIYDMQIDQKMDMSGIGDSCAYLDHLIEQQVQAGIAPQKIVIAGFSQGGLIALQASLLSDYALAGCMALSTYYPQACWQALPVAKQTDQKLAVFMAHGLEDNVIPLTVAEQARQRLMQSDCDFQWQSYPMPHSVCEAEIMAISQWLRSRLTA